MELTLREIAETLAPITHREATEIHNIFRNPAIKPIFRLSRPTEKKTHAGLYGIQELARARIVLALSDARLYPAEMATVSQSLDSPLIPGVVLPKKEVAYPASMQGDGVIVSRGLALGSIIAGTLADEDWDIRIKLKRDGFGQRLVVAWPKWRQWEESERLSGVVNWHRGEVEEFRGEIPASDLLRPLAPFFREVES